MKLPLQFLRFLAGAIAVLLMAAVPGAHSIGQANTFGQIIALEGHINDVAVDEVRQLVYAGNFSAGRVEVISMTTNQRISSFPTSPEPSAMSGMAMSLDARFLVAINVPVTSGVAQLASITAINLNDSSDRRHFPLADTPLAVTFITGGDALIVTTTRLLLFDPEDGSTRVLIDLENPPPDVILPAPLPTFPREVVTAFSNPRMILKQVWVGKGTEVGSELLSRGFRCGDGEGGGGLRGRGKLCRVVLRTRKLVELPPPPPIPEESRADRPVSGRCLTTVTGSPPAVFSCVAASAARTRCRSSGVLVAREKRP